jgi:hypothetical protein
MISKVNIGLAVTGILAILAGGGAAFIGSGVYNIGADDHHTKPVLAIIETLRERSIGVRVASIWALPTSAKPCARRHPRPPSGILDD